MTPLHNKEIVLAGGAGGIGAAVVSLLAAEGARLVVSYRTNRDRAAKFENAATLVQADLASPDDRRTLLDAAPALYGVVVLAGDPARAADPSQLEAAMRRSHDSNFLGPILLAREAADRMKASATPGAIVLISTMQANALFLGSTAYAAQKAALQHAAQILAKECCGPSNIRVNVV